MAEPEITNKKVVNMQNVNGVTLATISATVELEDGEKRDIVYTARITYKSVRNPDGSITRVVDSRTDDLQQVLAESQ